MFKLIILVDVLWLTFKFLLVSVDSAYILIQELSKDLYRFIFLYIHSYLLFIPFIYVFILMHVHNIPT